MRSILRCLVEPSQRQRQKSGVGSETSASDSALGQQPGQRPGAEVRFCEAVMVTSGSFGMRHSRWAGDVKGKPDSESGATHP